MVKHMHGRHKTLETLGSGRGSRAPTASSTEMARSVDTTTTYQHLYVDNNNNNGNNDNKDRYYKNCGKLSNARTPYFDGGLLRPGPVGV